MVNISFRTENFVWGKYPTTVICEINELQNCGKCDEIIEHSEYAYACDNKKFYHEDCFSDDHKKDFKIKNFGIHNDRFILVELNETLEKKIDQTEELKKTMDDKMSLKKYEKLVKVDRKIIENHSQNLLKISEFNEFYKKYKNDPSILNNIDEMFKLINNIRKSNLRTGIKQIKDVIGLLDSEHYTK